MVLKQLKRNIANMQQTKNDLSVEVRSQVCAILQKNLAYLIDASLQAKQSHWNVKGPQFFSLHQLFDAVYVGVNESIDLIAERIVQLGGLANGTIAYLHENSDVPAFPQHLTRGDMHVAHIANVLSFCCAEVRKAINGTADFGDITTSDLFTEVSRECDKLLWMVEAHSQADN